MSRPEHIGPGGRSHWHELEGRPHAGDGGRSQRRLERHDLNNDGQLDDEDRALARAAREARHLECHDLDNDGQLDDEERAVARQNRRGEHGGRHCGRRHHVPEAQAVLKELRSEGVQPHEYLSERLVNEYSIDLDSEYPDLSRHGVLNVIGFLVGELDLDEDSDHAEKLAALRHELEKAETFVRRRPYEL